MENPMNGFTQLSTAEEYLNFFSIPFDPKVVQVNRLHILKKFSQLIREIEKKEPDLGSEEKFGRYKSAMEAAYQLFVISNAVDQRLFKVFQESPPGFVSLGSIERK